MACQYDVLPANRDDLADLYNTLVHLPRSLLADDHLAIIVPSFEFPLPKGYHCNTFEECVDMYAILSFPPRWTTSISGLLPSTKRDVIKCVKDGSCGRFREESKTHVFVFFSMIIKQMYHFDGWDTLDPSVATTVHKCLHNDIQEPYVRCLGC